MRTDTVSNPDREVEAWTTFDLRLAYDFGQRGDVGNGVEIALAVQNLFDEDPPFVNNPNGVGYDEENADLLGRVVSLTARKRW